MKQHSTMSPAPPPLTQPAVPAPEVNPAPPAAAELVVPVVSRAAQASPAEHDRWASTARTTVEPPVASPPIPAAAPPPLGPPPVAVPVVPEMKPATPQPAADEHLATELAEALLAVVSEKTGYPEETLELDMDMEADLGIDSIKRVEILGTMQTRFPDLPRPKAEDLAELRTLEQVVEHLRANLPAAIPPASTLSRNANPSPAASAPQNGSTPVKTNGVPLSTARLRPLPPPDELELRLPDGWTCVLTDDGTANTARVAQMLAERGWQIVVLRFPTSLVAARPVLPPSIGRVVLQDVSEEHLERALASIAESYGPIAGFIHLHPSFVHSDMGRLFDPIEKAIVQQVFLIAKYLKPSLNAAARLGRSCFLTVTRLDGAFGTELRLPTGPVGGGLAGLTKSLRQEWSNVFCRALDLDPSLSPEELARAVLAELHDPDEKMLEVGYGARGRVTLVADHASSNGAGR
jgi:acyl carrier protein